jgi:hypothetical protein
MPPAFFFCIVVRAIRFNFLQLEIVHSLNLSWIQLGLQHEKDLKI